MPSGQKFSPIPTATRRDILKQTGAAAALIAAPSLTKAAPFALGGEIRESVTAWLALLDADQFETATFDFDSPTRRRWNYMLGAAFANGLAVENMTPEQKAAAMTVLETAFSAYGLTTAQNIMLQQDILRDEWNKGSPDRNRERFSLQVYGQPSATDPWAWRWEGHHLTITMTHLGDEIISATPKAFSSEPNTVPSGPYKGLVVLENEALGRALFADLNASQQTTALIRERSYGNILAQPGREDSISERAGAPLADLTAPQGDIVRRLIAIYTSDHLAGPLADTQRARIASEDAEAIRFGWAGRNEENESIYYRIHGESFLIEFATLRGQPQHHHTIVHDLQRNFGDHRL